MNKIFKFKKSISLSLVVMMLLLSLTGCGEKGPGYLKTLKVGVRSDVVNFSYYSDASQRFSGLEIDLITNIAEDLDFRKIEFIPVTTSNREELLESGYIDCIIGCYSYNDERAEKFDLTAPYYTDQFVVVSQSSTLFSNAYELGGTNIGVIKGSNAIDNLKELLLAEGVEDYTVTEFSSYDEIRDYLNAGEIDAAAFDKCIALGYSDESWRILNSIEIPAEYCIATRKGDEISSYIAADLNTRINDGTVKVHVGKWCTGGFDYE